MNSTSSSPDGSTTNPAGMPPGGLRRLALGWLAILVSASTIAVGQPLTSSRLEFQFSNPGARSLAIGGAFAAVADDATAAYANPAGLVQLTRAEVSVDTRSWSYSSPYVAGGRAGGTPSGQGIDIVDGLLVERSASNVAGLSFISYVYPRDRWTFALYHHRVALFETASESQGVFLDFGSGGFGRTFPLRETLTLDLGNTGLAVGWKASEQLAFGMGVIVTDGSYSQTTGVYQLGGPFGAADFESDNLAARTLLAVEETGVALNLGVLWNLSDAWTTALFYRQGATLEGELSLPYVAPAFAGEIRLEGSPILEFRVPDVAGVGLAYTSVQGGLKVSFETDRVAYSGLFGTEGENMLLQLYSDSWEYRIGAEYAMLQRAPIIALRAGLWQDTRTTVSSSDEIHFAAGVGVAGRRIQLDLGADFSETVDTLSLSAVLSF